MRWLLIVVFVVAMSVNVYRMRRGGPGPAQRGWVPKRFRARMNSNYEKHGWQEPFTDDGQHRNPNRSPI